MERFPGEPDVGTRVRLVRCDDPYTRLHPGTLGTVRFVDDMGTVHVDWDDGSRLGLVAQYGDAFEIVVAEATGQLDPQPAAGPTASGDEKPPRQIDTAQSGGPPEVGL